MVIRANRRMVSGEGTIATEQSGGRAGIIQSFALALESDPATAGLEPWRVTRPTSRTAFSSRFRGAQELLSVSFQEAGRDWRKGRDYPKLRFGSGVRSRRGGIGTPARDAPRQSNCVLIPVSRRTKTARRVDSTSGWSWRKGRDSNPGWV